MMTWKEGGSQDCLGRENSNDMEGNLLAKLVVKLVMVRWGLLIIG